MKIDMMVNFDAVQSVIGVLEGTFNEAATDEYKQGLFRVAHNVAAKRFDEDVAAAAHAGYLSHVYEFGVSGITAGPARISDATSAAARLFQHDLVRTGTDAMVTFNFRPAVVPNPKPTTASTGVPSKYLTKISKKNYIFYNKAMVMESGQTVEIKSKTNKPLFVPFYGEGARGNSTNQRGYMMNYGAISTRPGAQSEGTFGAFWKSWWDRKGLPMMGRHMQTNFEKDLARNMKLAEHAPGTLHPAGREATNARRIAMTRAVGGLKQVARNRRVEVYK